MISFLASFVLASHPVEPVKKRIDEKAALKQLIEEAKKAEPIKK
jgi:hypothetical protein